MTEEQIDARLEELESVRPFIGLSYENYYKKRLQFLTKLKERIQNAKNNL